MRCLPTESSGSTQGFVEKWLKARLSVFSPDYVYSSSVGDSKRTDFDERSSRSGAFGFIRMLGLSAAETSFLARAPCLESCLFALLQSQESFSVECYGDLSKIKVLNEHRTAVHSNGSSAGNHLRSSMDSFDNDDSRDAKTRCVQRMLMLPSRADSHFLRTKHPSGPELKPFESLVVLHQDRLLGTTKLLRSVRNYMLPVRAPQVCDAALPTY